MKANEPDYSQFQSIEHINAHIALNGFISELEQKGQDGLSWIKEATVREHLELEQAAILQQAREFSETWEERRKECGRVPAFPGAFFARQAPQFDDFTEKAILLLQNYGSYIQGEMLATCELFIDALKEEQTAVKELLRQISTLEAKAGESEALRGQIETLKGIINVLQNNNSAVLNTIKDKMNKLQATIEDQHAHAGELWATIPDCVRAALDAIEIEERDGKSISRPKTYDALRIAVVRRLKNKNTRKRTVKAGTFYPIADIAEAMAHEYRDFTAAQYIREFTPFGCLESNLHRAPQGTTEH